MDHATYDRPYSSSDDQSSRASFPASISTSSSSSRPTSQHRRRSSVSTRRESAEIMGISFPPSELIQDDPDTDSVRRRTLLTLEGCSFDASFSSSHSIGQFTTVEIPESSPVPSTADRRAEFALRLGHQSGSGSSSGKRESICCRSITPSITKDQQLHTLVEVDEDEEIGSPSKHTNENAEKGVERHLTSSPQPVPCTGSRGLKQLTLSTSSHRHMSANAVTRFSTAMACDSTRRKSSLSYKRATPDRALQSYPAEQSLTVEMNSLPTPELTPVSSEPPSLSPSEQTFLDMNHSSLLARISELEHILKTRTRSMSTATTNTTTTASSSRRLSISSENLDSPDEMFCLVREVTAERDELARNATVWESRVDALEKQVSVLTIRVENERRETWKAKDRVTSLEAENRRLRDSINKIEIECQGLKTALRSTNFTDTCDVISTNVEGVALPDEQRMAEWKEFLHESKIKSNIRPLMGDIASVPVQVLHLPGATNISLVRANMFMSDDDDELAHYEDEGEDDVINASDDSLSDRTPSRSIAFSKPASQDCLQQAARSKSSKCLGETALPVSAAFTTPPPTPNPPSLTSHHERKSSLEENWSFPYGARPRVRSRQEIDPFFDCLDHKDSDIPTPNPEIRSHFVRRADDGVDDVNCDMPPFVTASPASAAHALSSFHEVAPSLGKSKAANATAQMHLHATNTRQLKVDGSTRPTSVSTEHATSLEDFKKASPSAIPKLITTFSSPARINGIATPPKSVPRAKPATNVKSPRVVFAKPSAKEHNAGLSAREQLPFAAGKSSINKLSQPTNGLSSFGVYVPWSPWSNNDRTSKETVSASNALTTTRSPMGLKTGGNKTRLIQRMPQNVSNSQQTSLSLL